MSIVIDHTGQVVPSKRKSDSAEDLKPGIYEGIPFSEYCKWDAVNNSSLTAALQSPKHYKAGLDKEQEPTDAMLFGTMVHDGKLDPKELLNKYVVMPAFEKELSKEYKVPKASKEYKEKVEEWESQNKGKIIVTQDDYNRMRDMCTALDACTEARQRLSHDGPSEVSFVWRDRATGILCKGRIDKMNHRDRYISDLKTCQSCDDFERVIADRNYHRQGAFYIDGLYELLGEWYQHWIIAVEKDHPFGVKAAPLSDDAVTFGRKQYRKALRNISSALNTGIYEGYQSPVCWDIPQWKQESLCLNGPDGPIQF